MPESVVAVASADSPCLQRAWACLAFCACYLPALFLLPCLSALALLPAARAATPGATPLRLRQTEAARRSQEARQATMWWRALQAAIVDIHRRGPGGYSTDEAAHEALYVSFVWDERTGRLLFNPAGARPSFCSGAVYAAVLSALSRWDAAQPRRRISAEAWQALAPRRVPDGVGTWGYANANGPGFALLVQQLGAGVSFTDWAKARPSDIVKIWWNDALGGHESGHLAILVKDEGDAVRIWSSNQPTGGAADGYGFKTYPKSAIRRALFTRITNPAAFNRAPAIGEDAWLRGLMKESTTWEECARRCRFQR